MGILKRSTWEEFSDAGLVWWLNRILHTFGWSIVLQWDASGKKVLDAYPVRSDWLGFQPEIAEEKLAAFKKHTKGG